MRNDSNTTKAAAKGGLLSRLLLIFGSLLLLAALISAGYIIWQYVDAQNRYANITSIARLNVPENQTVDADLALGDMQYDWDALRAINPDIVGWIVVPGTNIDYPVVQGQDNDYYLYHLFDASSSGTGAIFVDYEGSRTLNGQNNVIYGHNMFDGSMFSDLLMYSNQDYFNNHRVVYLYTPDMNYELSAIATINVAADAPLRQFGFESTEAFRAFVQDTLSAPVTTAPDYQTSIAETESLYSLVTCETFDATRRIVLCCVPVKSEVPVA